MSAREPAVGHAELRHELPGGAMVLFTDRSNGSFALPGDPGEGAVAAEQRERALELAGVPELARGRQVHGSTVVRIAARAAPGFADVPVADGQATSVTGLAVMVVSADCLPVAVAGEGAVAMLHCGWRGLAAGVLEEGVQAVRELAGTGPLSAVIGPGAGPCCYEVGPEVHEALAVPRDDAPPGPTRGGPREAAGGRRGGGAHGGAVHDLRRALLLPPPRRSRCRQAGGDRMVELIAGIDPSRVGENLARIRRGARDRRPPSPGGARRRRAPAGGGARGHQVRRPRGHAAAGGGWGARSSGRTAPRISRPRSRPTATCSSGTSSASSRAAGCARSPRSCA